MNILQSKTGRYGVALLAIIVSALLRWLLPDVLSRAPYLGFYPAVVVGATLGGVGPGLFATFGSLLFVNYVFVQFDILDYGLQMRNVFWIIGGIGVSLLAGRLLDSKRRTQQINADLKIANDELRTREKELVERERELREGQEQLEAMFRSMTEGVAVIDINGNVIEINDAAKRIVSFNKLPERVEQLMGYGQIHEFYDLNGRPLPVEEWPASRALRGEVFTNYEIVVNQKNIGIKKIWSYGGAPIRDKDGSITMAVLSINDISERKQAEEGMFILSAIVESADDAIISKDLKGIIQSWNVGAENIFGYKAEEAIGREISFFIPFGHADEETDILQRIIAGEHIDRFESERTRKDGKIVPVALTFSPIKNASGEVVGVSEIAHDITEQNKAVREREATIEFLKLVNTSISIKDLIGKSATFFQQQSGCQAVGIRLKEGDDYPYYEARGFSKEFILLENSLCSRDLAGQIVRDSLGDPVIECMCGNVICGRFDPSKNFFTEKGSFWATNTTRLLATTTDADRQTKTRNRCNGEGYESVALIPLRMGGERLGLLQLNDRRKGLYSAEMIALWERLADYLAVALAKFRSDEGLKESEEQFRTLANSIPNLAWWANADGYITWYNQRWYEYTGTTPEQMEGWGWQSVHDPEVLPNVLEKWKGSIATGKPFDMAFPLRGADGVFLPFLTRVMPLKDSAGRVLRWFGTNTDISALKHANEELEAANKEMESFIYSISHDLRGPLRAIAGFSQVLTQDSTDFLDDKKKNYLARIQLGAAKMSQLIDDLLRLSRISRQELNKTDVDLSSLATRIVPELRESAPERNIRLVIKEGISAVADYGLINVVLTNLLDNAWKFTAKIDNAQIEFGTINNKGKTAYYVKDNGAGFNQEYVNKMFLPFHRLHGAGEFEGTGIGLSIVERIIRRHGGTMWAEGEENKGATIFFTLG